MAFGDSWGIVRDFAREVRSSTPKNGTLDEAIFATEMPPLAVSTIALLDVSSSTLAQASRIGLIISLYPFKPPSRA